MSLRGLKLILQVAFCIILVSGPARAATIFWQDAIVPIGLANDLGQGADHLLIGVASGNEGASFTHYFSFEALASLTAVSLPDDPGSFGKFKNLTLQWLEADGATTFGDALIVTNNAGEFQAGTLYAALAIGSLYHLSVTGDFGSEGGGLYDINLTTTPIPPALLLFGSALAGLGFLGRRRRATANPLA